MNLCSIVTIISSARYLAKKTTVNTVPTQEQSVTENR